MSLVDILIMAGVAGGASVLGGFITTIRKPSEEATALTLGFAGGALLAAIAFELVAGALERAPIWLAASGALVGLFFIFGFDMALHTWPPAALVQEGRPAPRLHRRLGGREDRGVLLAAGIALEELVEGAAIGLGAAGDVRLGLIIALTIAVDNFAEGLAIGAVMRNRGRARKRATARTLGWTSLIGGTVVVAALTAWILFSGAGREVVAILLSFVAGGLLYLTITQIIPEAQVLRHEREVGISAGLGFIAVLVLSSLV